MSSLCLRVFPPGGSGFPLLQKTLILGALGEIKMPFGVNTGVLTPGRITVAKVSTNRDSDKEQRPPDS